MDKPNKTPKLRFPEFKDAWEQRKLDEITDVRDGTHDSPNYLPSGFPLLTSKNVKDGFINYDDVQFISELDYEKINQRSKVDINDILMGMIGTIGNLALIREKPNFAIKNVALIKDEKKSNQYYLYAYLQSQTVLKQFSNALAGGTQKFISLKNIRELNIGIPSTKEQEKIGQFFKSLDNLITLHQCKFEILQKVKKSLLQKMFPKDGESIPEVRFPEFSDAWEQRKLSDIADRVTRKNSNLESNLPLTISAQFGLIDQNEFFDKRIASKDLSGYYLIKKGEFAYNKSTSNDAEWGVIKRLERYEKGVLSTLYIVFKIKDETKTASDYLVSYYSTDLWHRGVQAVAAEGARNHGLLNIAPKDFFETTLKIPQQIDEQRKIGDFFKSIDNLITLHQRKLETLTTIKKSLLQQMFV